MGNRRYRQRSSDLYSPEQTERVIQSAGGTVAGEVDTDWIVFCPFHPNHNTPAAEIDKEKGTFFCFACRQIASLEEYYMKMTGDSMFAAARPTVTIGSNFRLTPVDKAVSHSALRTADAAQCEPFSAEEHAVSIAMHGP